MKPQPMRTLLVSLLLAAAPACADSAALYDRYRAAPAGSTEKERLYEEYAAAVRSEAGGRTERATVRSADPYARPAASAVADPYARPAAATGADAALDRLSAAEIHERYRRETDPDRKRALYRAYVERVRRGETAANGAAVPDAYGKIPTPQYLADTPAILPPEARKSRKRGLGGLIRGIEDTSEKSLGTLVTSGLELMNGINRDPELNARLNRVAALIERVQERPIDIRYKLLNMNVINAFACPGGTVYTTPAMLNFVSSDSELAFVLAHETGHVVARHSMKQMEQGMALDYLIRKTGWQAVNRNKDAARVAAAFLALRYSRKDEFEADDYGYRYMTAAGYNPYAAVTFMNKMKQQFEAKKNSQFVTWLQTHPSLHDRYDRSVGFYNAFAASHPEWRKVNGR